VVVACDVIVRNGAHPLLLTMIGTSSPSLQLQIPRRCARRDDAL